MEKHKPCITLEVLNEVCWVSGKKKQLIYEPLEQKCLKENISVEKVTYFLINLEAKELHSKYFYRVVLGFKVKTFSVELLPQKIWLLAEIH